ncbi:hypothetical protein DKX38_022207 [Salix brachista]|uniref:RNA helicase n=1 Tax=Salix brachista TaxID=2182728 RepID=A0A5N5JZ07_9ROSI|nr:hypothetical protein DKX38_022207 [Salix brachista]
MEGKALTWYYWLKESSPVATWEEFKEAIRIRFGPSAYEDPVGAFTKLRQTGSVEEYQSAFEILSNKITDLSEEFRISTFLSGLRDELRIIVTMFRPNTLSAAFGERKDRRDFEHLSAMATRMGLHSRQYSRIVVFSKVPLPNYRPDLDDKRPQREVILPFGLQREVDAHLKSYVSKKPTSRGFFPPNSLSRSNNGGSMETGERIYARPELSVQNSVSMERILSRKSLQLRNQQEEWQESPEGQKMIEFRRSLPAYKEKDLLLKAISENQVIVICSFLYLTSDCSPYLYEAQIDACLQVIVVSGETGCGKTTQLPQYILEYEIEAARGAACSIICTQPRRISAMSVSERVAAERGEKLGESVGYKVRLEGMRGRDTRLLFCTTGILLRRLLLDRDLKGVTHVIVDEIHERGMNEDFLLIVLRDLLPRRPELRLILMSATLNADLFSSYFGGAPAIHIPVSLALLISVLITCRKPIPYPLKPAGKDLVEDCPSLEFLSLLFSFASVHSLFVLLPPLFFVQSIGIPLCMLLSRDS